MFRTSYVFILQIKEIAHESSFIGLIIIIIIITDHQFCSFAHHQVHHVLISSLESDAA